MNQIFSRPPGAAAQSNTATQQNASAQPAVGRYRVTGMTCAACQANVQKAVGRLDGVTDCDVNLLAGTMTVRSDPGRVTPDQIEAAVRRIGYEARQMNGASEAGRPAQPGASADGNGGRSGDAATGIGQPASPMPPVNLARQNAWEAAARLKKRFIASVAWLIPLMYIAMGSMLGLPLPAFLIGPEHVTAFALTQFLLTLPVLYLNRTVFIGGLKALIRRVPNMDALIAVGSGASALYGVFVIYRVAAAAGLGQWEIVHRYHHRLYFESAAMILTIITLGRYLEARSKGHTTDAISRLIELTPDHADVRRGDRFVPVPVSELRPGDVVQVLTGASVPADGMLLEGFAVMDESALTGESMPVEKQPGETVTGGTVSRGGYFTFEVTRTGGDTALSAIIRLVEEASTSKAPVARLADRVAAVFVPAVMSIALLVLILWLLIARDTELALNMAVSVLVISCPCALGLATPLAIMAGTGSGSRFGILIKSGEALETAHRVDTVVLDKTGTITRGEPAVTDILPADGTGADELLRLAAGVEQYSEHVLARAVCRAADERRLPPPPGSDFAATPGMGVFARLPEGAVTGGNLNLARRQLAGNPDRLRRIEEQADALAGRGHTPLVFFLGDRLLGILGLADAVKPTSAEAVRQMKDLGLRVIMLTGDNARTAEAVRSQVGIDDVVANVLPQDKQAVIRRLQREGRRVAMVGDGINDAPALEQADVGMAIGSGTDIAIDAADVVLMKDDLRDVPAAVDLSRRTMRNIRENLFWAFFYNVLCIPLAAGAFYSALGLSLSPMVGSAAMAMSSLFVVGNALRLTRFKPRRSASATPAAPPKPPVPPEPDPAPVPAAPNDHPSDTKTTKGQTDMKHFYQLKIEGMMCQHCVAHVRKALSALPGAEAVDVNLEAGTAALTAAAPLDAAAVRAAVEDAGYTVLALEQAD